MLALMKPLFVLPLLGFAFIACKPQATTERSDPPSEAHAVAVDQAQTVSQPTKGSAPTSEVPDDLPDEDEPTPGERLDHAIEKTGEGLQKAGEKTEEGLRKAGAKTGDALQRLGEKIERAAER